MDKVLVLGAGLVTGPIVKYLLNNNKKITLADIDLSKAEKLINNNSNGIAVKLNVDDTELLENLIEDSDIVVSLLPYTFHVKIAKICIAKKKNMVTASYVSKEMKELNKDAVANGVIILNEVGLDPGIDHMSAMKIIDDVRSKGGKIVSFESCCGGLPAPDSNNNPLGYKFSWSPRGVVMAGRNSAKYLKDNDTKEIPGEELFKNNWLKSVETLGDLEVYPNRDSLIYKELYGLNAAHTVFRGTFRNPGWCKTFYLLSSLGYLNDNSRTDLLGKRHIDILSELIKVDDSSNAVKVFLDKYNLAEDSSEYKNLEWLGLFSEEKIELTKTTLLDVLADLMLKKMSYQSTERDMVVLQHDFIAEYPDKKEKITSLLIDFGIPSGDSSMARTVSLPTAISAKLILEGKINKTGVHIPISKDIYLPVLEELENLDIKLKETVEKI
ncbi:MAG: saccharopine dehydrogenase NADP-binding domain-containing protein [Melioribacteraceae bacterium]|nr:saccharopine dehydrogenase NADP-binding domain-containing protein [Melioribacteraceae bacterium]